MKRNRFPKLLGFVAVNLSTCFATSCAMDFRDAALAGVFDYTTGTVTYVLSSLLPISDAIIGGAGVEE